VYRVVAFRIIELDDRARSARASRGGAHLAEKRYAAGLSDR